ncbi:MAG: 23S rRNA (pseudouridine(1915)-N(3))-methyltransferase RlmH [Lachnospiraceae bacterium]|nr:23S rRNA (pseudouridine(1915)-N(3))-methyltransferase RlmH [Lachnospiraceae bacterium]
MKIDIIAVGKVKESFYREAVAEFEKRLSKYCKLRIVEVADEKTPEGASPAQEEQIKAREGERILKNLREDAYVITLEIQGQKLDSLSFAQRLDHLGVQGKSHLQFVIGGSLGLDQRVSQRADFKLSFSDMTFPHQLMRVILLEQIYRAYRIINGEPYHK